MDNDKEEERVVNHERSRSMGLDIVVVDTDDGIIVLLMTSVEAATGRGGAGGGGIMIDLLAALGDLLLGIYTAPGRSTKSVADTGVRGGNAS